MIAADEFDRRQAVELSEWVAALCRQYSQATGWTVRFVADATEPLLTDSEVSDVVADQRRVGTLELLLDRGVDQDTRRRARATTQLLAHVISEIAVSRHDADKRSRHLKMMLALGQLTEAIDDVEAELGCLLGEVADVVEASSLSLHLLVPETESLALRFLHPLGPETVRITRRVSESPTDLRAMNQGMAIIQEVTELQSQQMNWVPDRTNSAVCLGVDDAGGILGTLWATSRRLLGFEAKQLSVLKALAQHLGSLLERIALEKEEETRERMMRELQGISKTQSGEQLGILPADSGFDAVGRCRSVCEVGGDLCEMIPLGEGRTLVAVGDACGHSVQAAFVMTAVRSAMRAVIDDAESGSLDSTVVVAKINRALCRVTAGHQFMSCLVGIIDRKRMVFDYTNAGHPVPILYRQGQGVSLESHGLPLGILTDAEYSSSQVALRGEDLLVLFSDGLLETMNEAEELFQPAGVMSALSATATADPLDEVLEQIWGSCERHGVGDVQDDRTLLVVRMKQTKGPRRPHHMSSVDQAQLSSR
ncbi:MAG: hypothetical protein CMJ65_05395 [Planctomycetaceae bacterium]|nr:hypothetical protein [Planctomycetaceae bacterium]